MLHSLQGLHFNTSIFAIFCTVQIEGIWKASSRFPQEASVCQQLVDELKLVEEKYEATDEGMIATNAKARTAEAMKPPARQELEASEAGKKFLNLHNKQVKAPSKDERLLRSGSKALSSFLALPNELHLQVVLPIAHSIDSGLLSLRGANGNFVSIISNNFHSWGTTRLENKQFKAADRLYGSLRVKDRQPGTHCQCLLAKERFHMQAKQGRKAFWHKFVFPFWIDSSRFCYKV